MIAEPWTEVEILSAKGMPDRNIDEGEERLKNNQMEAAFSIEKKRKFALQVYTYNSTTCAKKISIYYSLLYDKSFFDL